MARKRVAYRKRNQNKLSMFLVTLVVLMIMVVAAVGMIELKQEISEKDAKIAELDAQIADEKERAEEIAEYEKETQTLKYIEEMAKEKLGLVYEGEILFKEGD